MNALLLATALVGGLAPGDAGEMVQADVGAVCVDFSGEWEGTFLLGVGQDGGPFLLPLGELALTDEGNGRVLVRPWDETLYLGIYRLERDKVYICYSYQRGKRPTSFVQGFDQDLWVIKRPEKAKSKK
jgi:hypothetical protein